VGTERSPLLRIERVARGDAWVLSLRGEVDLLTAPELTNAIDEVVRQPVPLLVIDLRAVTFLASAGLSALVEAQKRVPAQLDRLVVVADHAAVLRPLQLTGIDRTLTIVDTVEVATVEN
jgi:anti-anti-sigma factor